MQHTELGKPINKSQFHGKDHQVGRTIRICICYTVMSAADKSFSHRSVGEVIPMYSYFFELDKHFLHFIVDKCIVDTCRTYPWLVYVLCIVIIIVEIMSMEN